MNCPNCGMELGHETEYCINCGAKQAKAGRFSAKKREQGMFNKDVVTGSSTYTPNSPATGSARNNADDKHDAPSRSGASLDEQQSAPDDSNPTGKGGHENSATSQSSTAGGANAQGAGNSSTGAKAPEKFNLLFTIVFVLIIAACIFRNEFSSFSFFSPITGYTESAQVSAEVLNISYCSITVKGQTTVIKLYVDSPIGDTMGQNGFVSYTGSAAVMCDGEVEVARVNYESEQIDGKDVVTCNIIFANGNLFEIAHFSLHWELYGTGEMYDVNITVEDASWVQQ